MIKRAIIHVENTENLLELTQYLTSNNWSLLSANKTEDYLRKNKIPVNHEISLSEASTYTNDFVRFIHEIISSKSVDSNYSMIHSDSSSNIFLVCVNIIPQYHRKNKKNESIENAQPADFFLSSILHASYINRENLLILTDPSDYKEALIQLKTDNISSEFKEYLAAKALNLVSAYDAGIAQSVLNHNTYAPYFPNYPVYPFQKEANLQSGSNPHQSACFYKFPEGKLPDELGKFQIKDMNYNTFADFSLTWEILNMLHTILRNQYTVSTINSDGYEFTTQFTPLTGTVFTVAVQYQNILGAALASNIHDSFKNTYTYDTEHVHNIVLGCSAVIDTRAAEEIAKTNLIAIVAPDFTPEAKQILSENKKIKLIPAAKIIHSEFEGHFIYGGVLLQQKDNTLFNRWTIKTKNRPSQFKADELTFGMLLAMRTRSYTALLLKQNSIAGIAQGFSSPVKALREVLIEARENVERKNGNTDFSETENPVADVLICDSAIPFCEEIKNLVASGVTTIIETGGSSTDQELIDFCDEHEIVLIFTGMTHINL